MTIQNSQRGKEYLETAQTLLRAAKTMTDLAIAAAHSSEGFVPARPQSPDLRSCATKVATTSQFDWRKAYGYGISKGTNLTAHLRQPGIPGIVLGLAVSALAVYAIVQAPTERRIAERLKAEQIQREDREHCERFRVQPGSEDFAACVADLTEIRRHQRDRSLAEASGMF
jgi:hypothetical protein